MEEQGRKGSRKAGQEPRTSRGKDGRKLLGNRGEQAAARFLQAKGFRILARNVRSRFGEIDLIALDGKTIVFVEVKLRRPPSDPLEAVDRRKQEKLSRLALDFLLRNGMLGRPARFDVVAVEGQALSCTHIADAFDCQLEY